ncbi:MAG: hypothetical protein E6K18_04030 [Methanobacteriota archaeon]|nr:MAG: hypothetical protein E6K18_04030 [Euryarchaeota archaeon]
MNSRKGIWSAFAIAVLAMAWLANVASATPPPQATGRVYADDQLWATFATNDIKGGPEQSLDKIFVFPGTDLIPVGEAGPGNPEYNSGRWDVHEVTFTGMAPTQFTSDEAIWYHASIGDLTISGTVKMFHCPLFKL